VAPGSIANVGSLAMSRAASNSPGRRRRLQVRGPKPHQNLALAHYVPRRLISFICSFERPVVESCACGIQRASAHAATSIVRCDIGLLG
jgi:hypothetical protein